MRNRLTRFARPQSTGPVETMPATWVGRRAGCLPLWYVVEISDGTTITVRKASFLARRFDLACGADRVGRMVRPFRWFRRTAWSVTDVDGCDLGTIEETATFADKWAIIDSRRATRYDIVATGWFVDRHKISAGGLPIGVARGKMSMFRDRRRLELDPDLAPLIDSRLVAAGLVALMIAASERAGSQWGARGGAG
jgi:hypothetical protein